MILLLDRPRCGDDWLTERAQNFQLPLIFPNQKYSLTDVKAIYCEFSQKLDNFFLSQFPALGIIASSTTSLTHIDLSFCERNNIEVISLRDFPTVISGFSATSEIALWHMIELARRVSSSASAVREGNWNRNEFVGVTLAKKYLGILGFGRLGRQVAKICESLGMQILVYDLDKNKVDLLSTSYLQVDSLAELFSKCDLVSIHIDDRPENRNLINRSVLEHIKSPNFMLINTSRGFIINETDVVESLQSGRMRAFGADVLAGEDYTDTEPDWLLRSPIHREFVRGVLNVSLSPHIGGATTSTMSLASRAILEELMLKYSLHNDDKTT